MRFLGLVQYQMIIAKLNGNTFLRITPAAKKHYESIIVTSISLIYISNIHGLILNIFAVHYDRE